MNRWLLNSSDISHTARTSTADGVSISQLSTYGLQFQNGKTKVNSIVVDNNVEIQESLGVCKIVSTDADDALDCDAKRIVNVKDPLDAQDVATKQYVLDNSTGPHTHVKADITDFPHTHQLADIVNFGHTHVKAEISDFTHTHQLTDIVNFTHTHLTTEIAGLQGFVDASTTDFIKKIVIEPSIELLFDNIVGNEISNTGTYNNINQHSTFTTSGVVDAVSYNGKMGKVWNVNDEEAKAIHLGYVPDCGLLDSQRFTISVWVQDGYPYGFNNWADQEVVFQVGDPDTGHPTTVMWGFQQGASNNLTYGGLNITTQPNGEWHHLVVASDGINMKTYHQGKYINTVPSPTLPNLYKLRFGTAYDGGGRSLSGSFGSIRIWNNLDLTELQVKTLYDERLSDDVWTTAGTTAWRTKIRGENDATLTTYVDNAVDRINHPVFLSAIATVPYTYTGDAVKWDVPLVNQGGFTLTPARNIITVPEDGIYMIQASVSRDNTSGTMSVYFVSDSPYYLRNADTTAFHGSLSSISGTAQLCTSAIIRMNAGNWVNITETASVSSNWGSNDANAQKLSITKIGEVY